uniref:ATP synthase F0 subunit 8 n=1 Tax=Amblema plicata TaxID=52360 RepID=A0A7D6C0C2_AMBPL|nr:ATP synthase F0 subunit 8 [Amblema plicata]QLJ92867.1 ATP synthase F0 subunit 8 [Amblema plicata]
MPQLSPMSWVLVFGILLVCVVLFMLSVWWSAGGEYKVVSKAKMSGAVGVGASAVKWGFNKKFGLGSRK